MIVFICDMIRRLRHFVYSYIAPIRQWKAQCLSSEVRVIMMMMMHHLMPMPNSMMILMLLRMLSVFTDHDIVHTTNAMLCLMLCCEIA